MRPILWIALAATGAFASAIGEAIAVSSGFPGRNGTLVYETNGHIYAVEATGEAKRVLRRSRDIDDNAAYPTWSPNGRTILFAHGTRGNDIVLRTIGANGRGEQTRRAAQDLYGPFSWSPDGQRIAGAGLGDDLYQVIFVGTHQVTRSPPRPNSQADTDPAWSPDGALLCFARTNDGGTFLLVMRPDGGGPRVLTPGAAPDWAPDASRLVFVDGGDLFFVARDGTSRRRLTRTPGAEAAPVWSPDGKQIAFRRAGALWAIGVDGRHERLIVRGVGARAQPDWQPRPR